ncbi:MAG: IPTL-CTERM sorting domain-containing protein [Casimicrobiaceae bacterium]
MKPAPPVTKMGLPCISGCYFVYANNANVALTSWSAPAGGITNTYKLFAIASMPVTLPTATATATPALSEWAMIVLTALIGVGTACYLTRRSNATYR